MDKQTIDSYNQMAKQYDDETEEFWNRFPRTFLDKFIELSGEKILDVGSGPGRDGLLIQERGKEVIGVDASEAMVKMSSERGLYSVAAEFNSLPFENSSFDGVWSYTTLLHVPKSSVTTPLQEISRVLKPAGIFALGLIEGHTEGYQEKRHVNRPRWFSFYQKDEVCDLCRDHGFKLLHFETFTPRSKNYLNFIFQKTTKTIFDR